jgi:hypothetical protein
VSPLLCKFLGREWFRQAEEPQSWILLAAFLVFMFFSHLIRKKKINKYSFETNLKGKQDVSIELNLSQNQLITFRLWGENSIQNFWFCLLGDLVGIDGSM